jgi:very-short-patch-repair endonuclease
MLPPSVVAKASDGSTGLLFHKAAEGGYERGRTARNEIEAEDVAQAVLRHAREHPDQSLGVGTFSVAQRDAVRDRIDALVRKHPELDAFMKARAGRDGLFVKNLENIQGDERDVIFISIGYGRDRDGRLTQNFGPVGREGGERRLNVLITRARKRCEVFSSLVAEDIRIDGPAPRPGVVALREFLKLARDGYADIASRSGRDFDSDFEAAVAHEVRRLGYEAHPQVGMAGFFIDIGVIDPRNGDRYLLGIECDGAAYHASRYVRDRDRLRQQILESRGWRIHRIWSTDWLHRRAHEIGRLRSAIEGALSGASPAEAEAESSDEEAPVAEETVGSGEAGPAAAAEAGVRKALKPYEMASFRVKVALQDLHRLKDSHALEIIKRIVSVEQPIHEAELHRRFAAICGLGWTGSSTLAVCRRGLALARKRGELVREGAFWSAPDSVEVAPRDRSGLEATEMVRKPQMISPREFAAAAVLALERNLALARKELIVEASRLLGFARTRKEVATAIDRAIRAHLQGRLEEDHLGRLRLRG